MLRFFAIAVGLFLIGPAASEAQWVRPTSGLTGFPVSLVGQSGAYALEANPGALSMVSGWDAGLYYSDPGVPGLGLYGAAELPFGISLAAGADWLLPDGRDEGRLSLGGAYAPSSLLGVGLAFRYVDRVRGRSAALDIGISWRPSAAWGLGFVVHDLLGPLGLAAPEPIPASAVLALQVRPFESDVLYLEGGIAADTDGRVGLRGLIGGTLPHVGRITGMVEGEDIAGQFGLRLTASLAIDWGRVSGHVGVIGDVSQERVGAVAALHIRSAARAGLPRSGYVDDLELRGGLGSRRLLAVLRRLDQDRFDPRVRGVFLRLRGTGIGLAAAQEIRQAIAALEASGRPVVCHLDSASGAEFYACAAASTTEQDPAGTVQLIGPSTATLLYGEALRRLGIRTDFLRIGMYKSAVEVYGSSASSEASREARQGMIDDAYARLVSDLAGDHGVTAEEAAVWIDEGPYVAHESFEAQLVDGLSDEHEIGPVLADAIGISRLQSRTDPSVRTGFGVAARVAVLVLDGSVVDGNNVDYPLVEIHQTGARTYIQAIEAARVDPTIRSVVLRIDSPGGSALAADQIWRAVRRLREVKPVIASMGPMATSAAYYVASACDTIYANPTTITGSIGVLYGKVDFAPLAEMLGVGVEHIARGRHAGADSPYRAFTAEERAELADKVRIFYRLFLRRVAEGRNMRIEDVHAVAQGRIWTGDAAVRLGLVDELGGFVAALAEARSRAHLSADAPFVIAPGRPASLLEYIVGPTIARAAGDAGPISQAHTGVEWRALGIAAALATSGDMPMAIVPVDMTLY